MNIKPGLVIIAFLGAVALFVLHAKSTDGAELPLSRIK
jgi:hypothetical protein